jgi:hypothetical protein
MVEEDRFLGYRLTFAVVRPDCPVDAARQSRFVELDRDVNVLGTAARRAPDLGRRVFPRRIAADVLERYCLAVREHAFKDYRVRGQAAAVRITRPQCPAIQYFDLAHGRVVVKG